MPLFACFPVLTLFTSLGILAVLMYAAGAGKGAEGQQLPAGEPHPKPPYWFGAVALAVVLLILFLLSVVTDG